MEGDTYTAGFLRESANHNHLSVIFVPGCKNEQTYLYKPSEMRFWEQVLEGYPSSDTG
jgi:hypothetical protein